MGTTPTSEMLTFRLILIDPASMGLLAIQGNHESLLPRESVQVGRRIAQALTESIRQRFGLCVIQLAVLWKSTLPTGCAVYEILERRSNTETPFHFEAFENFSASDLTEEERHTVARLMKGEEKAFGRFAALGWIKEFEAKLPFRIDRSSIRQMNQGIDFCLMKFENVSGTSFWFKAVGKPNIREFGITEVLAREFPMFVPEIVTWIPDWSGWVAEHVEGILLDNSRILGGWEKCLGSLATLQENAATFISLFHAAGAKDRSCARLKAALNPFIEEIRHAMHAQSSKSVRPLSDGELDQFNLQSVAAITILEESRIPNSLLHGDIGHGNVIISSTRATFLDWAEAGIGHPFLSAEHLLANHERLHPVEVSEREMMRDFYASLWMRYASPAELELLTKTVPAVAALAYGIDTWQANATRSCPERAWPLLRSIARRTKRELAVASRTIL